MPRATACREDECPFCGSDALTNTESLRAERVVRQCDRCGKHSTRHRGKCYPHDDASDPDSTFATVAIY